MAFANKTDTLRRAQQNDESALEELVRENMGLIKSVACRFTGRGVDWEDLIQMGAIGFIKAVRGFDPSLSLQLSTYAVPMIAGEIKRYFRDNGPIKVSRKIKADAQLVFRFIKDYRQNHPNEPTVAQIARETGLDTDEVILAMEASQPTLSLYEKGPTDQSIEDMLGEDPMEEPFWRIALTQALQTLEPKEKQIIHLRYFKHLTQSQTAKLLQTNQVKICREEKRIVAKLKKELVV